MPNERMNINRLQRQHMLETMSAEARQAEALERIVELLEAHLECMGAKLPERKLPAESDALLPPASFNPHTESAPGVPLPGQEK